MRVLNATYAIATSLDSTQLNPNLNFGKRTIQVFSFLYQLTISILSGASWIEVDLTQLPIM